MAQNFLFLASGEAGSVNTRQVQDWNIVLQDIITDIGKGYIYNLGEIGVFYQALSMKTMFFHQIFKFFNQKFV